MSTNLPPLEARVAAQERLQTILSARIEELHLDMQASFRELAAYHEQLDARLDKIDGRLDKLEARLDGIEANMATKEDIAAMATKDDMAAMETRILGAFQQLLAALNTQPSKE